MIVDYTTRYIASVAVVNGKIRVLGGPDEKQELKKAAQVSSVCYVRNVPEHRELKLVNKKGRWVIPTEELTSC